MDEPRLLGPGQGESIRPFFEIKAGREELVLTETRYEPGQVGPDPHVHHHHVDAFYVLEGELDFLLGEETTRLGAGAFVLIPPDVVHTFSCPESGPARYVNIHAPGAGFDEYLRSGFKAEFDQHEPPPDGGRPPSEVLVRLPGEGEPLELGDSRAAIKCGGADAIGSLTVIELDLAPGFPGPAPHLHERMADSFYVLDGELTVQLGEESAAAGPGSYALVPPGNPHTIRNPRNERVRALNVSAPGGLDAYLREVAADPGRVAEIAARYDVRAI
jgi:mannose-6-phosphate isomerase-like protein (cupin superfamily)